MPTTEEDLIRWEQEKDIDKFLQILEYLTGEKFLNMRQRAIEVLGRLRDPVHIPLLMREMARTPELTEKIGDIMVSWGPDAAQLLADYATTPGDDKEPRNSAIVTISKFDEQTAFNNYYELVHQGLWLTEISKTLDEKGLTNKFLEFVGFDFPFHQFMALRILYHSPVTSFSLDLLKRGSADEDAQVRNFVYDILSSFTYRRDAGRFMDVHLADFEALAKNLAHTGLNDEEPLVRRSSLQIVRRLKDEGSLAKVIDLLRDEWFFVKEQAVYCLAHFPHSGTKEILQGFLHDGSEDDVYRRGVVAALGTCTDEGVYEILAEVLQSTEEEDIQFIVINRLLSSRPQEAIGLLLDELLRNPKLFFILRRCRGWTYKVSEFLFELLEQQEENLRKNAVIWMFAQLGSSEDVLRFCSLVADSEVNLELVLFAVDRILRKTTDDKEAFLKVNRSKGDNGFTQVADTLIERWSDPKYKRKDPFMQDLGLEERDPWDT